MSKLASYIPTYLIIKEFKGDPEILKCLEALIEMTLLDEAFYRIGEIRLTAMGSWAQIAF